MADLLVLDELLAYLVAQGVAQRPSETPSVDLPSIWKQPRDGAPEPRKSASTAELAEAATITLVAAQTGPPLERGDEAIEEALVDVVVRARSNQTAQLIHRQIRGLLHPVDAPYARRLWTMGDLLVESSRIWRGEQPVDSGEFYTRTQSFVIAARRKALAGTPLTP
jgi:hypothetical protein